MTKQYMSICNDNKVSKINKHQFQNRHKTLNANIQSQPKSEKSFDINTEINKNICQYTITTKSVKSKGINLTHKKTLIANKHSQQKQ